MKMEYLAFKVETKTHIMPTRANNRYLPFLGHLVDLDDHNCFAICSP